MKCAISWIVGLSSLLLATASDWSYEGSAAPKTWSEHYPTCGGKYQSPINIEGGYYIRSLRPTWLHYELVPSTMSVTNNGHSVSLTGNGTKPLLQLGYDSVYELSAVHFHWGKKNSEGSEHTIRGRRYPLEMHAVHYRVRNGAIVNPPEIIVVAVLFQISHRQPNRGLDKFADFIPNIRNAETSSAIHPFAWSTLIPQFRSNFFVYRGSLTTPPCSEVVTFFVREQIAKLSEGQMEAFRLLLNDEKDELAGNFRPLQLLNGRNVFYVLP